MTPSALYALMVLFAINLMNFFDRQIIGGVGEGIRREWGLSDTALGLLGTVFTLLYAVFGLPLGRLSDSKPRRVILSAGVFVWSALTAASGLARNFGQLIAARLGVGVGEATCSPASTSLIGDLVPTTSRARAVAIWMLGLPLGLGLANGAGGWILQNWGWRNAFHIAAIPGLFCAVAAIMMREPSPGTKEAPAAGDIVGFSLLMGLGVGVMFAYYSTVYATIHDVVEPSLRGTAMALYFFAMYVLGASMGPVGTGLVSDYFTFQRASAAGAVAPLPFGEIMMAELRSLVGEAKGFNLRALEPFRAGGLHTAMYIVPILAGFLAVVLFAASRTVKKDVANLQAWMRSGDATAKAS